MAVGIDTIIIDLVINIIFWVIAVTPALWIAGRLIAGKQNAKFTDALWIVIAGTIIFYFTGFLLEMFFEELFGFGSVLLSLLVLLIVWLALVKHFFDCGWLKALAISIVAVIIAVIIWFIIGIILALIGISAGWFSTGTSILSV